jgi:hypothetical protein
LSACGGSGDSNSSSPPPSPDNVTVSGRIEFERPTFKNVANGGLNIAAPTVQPARQVVVEAIDPTTRARIGTATSTDASGNYSLSVPANTNVLISARAEMVKTDAAPTWDFKVRDNTSNGALYVLDGAAFNSGNANSTRNLRALTGWNGTAYVDADRAAASFAILDTVYQAKELIRSAQSGTNFPPLDLYWSAENRNDVDEQGDSILCTSDGAIGTTFYTTATGEAGNCTDQGSLAAGIYVLGGLTDGAGDTDEFDQHVIAHEFGHYVEDKFSRSDSIGGEHRQGDRLDLRVAFGEGWGNAYSGMVLNDPVYRDSGEGLFRDGGFNLESDMQTAEGWFSEFSIGEILWDLFDSVDDGADHVSLGFAPLFSVITGPQKTTPALTSIFSFADALKKERSGEAAGINAILTGEMISGTDAFGAGEANTGGSTTALPIYEPINVGTPMPTCVTGGDDSHNKLGSRRFFTLTLTDPAMLTILAVGQASSAGSVLATDPDIFIYRSGLFDVANSSEENREQSIQRSYPAGVYVIDVFDYDYGSQPRCMTVSVTGS